MHSLASRVLSALILLLLTFRVTPSFAQIFLDTPPLYEAHGYPSSVAVADLNGDDKLDLVTANYDRTISVLLGRGKGSFSPHQDFASGDNDVQLTLADFNGDGNLDVATANYWSGTISVLMGNGDGTFQTHIDYSESGFPLAIVAADFNSDGKADLAIINGAVTILVGKGDGTFRAARQVPTVSYPSGLAVADLNHDGKLDLVVAINLSSYLSGSVSVLLGNGDATFQPEKEYLTTNSPNSVAVADFNGDGALDLVTANGGNPESDTVSVLLGNGDGTFQDYKDYPTREAHFVTASDLNGDGRIDLITADYGSDTVGVLLGNGDGSFQDFTNYSAGVAPASIAVEDFDDDGKADLAVAAAGGSVAILLGNGHGTFAARADYATGNLASAIAVADFNRDGRPDLVTADYFDSAAMVLLQDEHGQFHQKTVYSVAFGPGTIAAADFDADGNPDFAAPDSCNVAVFLGNGDGTFRPKIDSPGCSSDYRVADFNHDGKLDIAGVGTGGVVLLGNGDGTFAPPNTYAAGPAPGDTALGDFNHDGNIDIAVANESTPEREVSVLLGNSDGSFQQPRLFAIDSGAFTVAAGDLDGDGNVDLVVGHYKEVGNRASILLGNGDGTFRLTSIDDRPKVGALSLRDVNGDGKLDLLGTGESYFSILSLSLGKGDGTFQAPIRYEAALGPFRIAVADLNGDGSPDLAVTNGYPENTVSIVLNLRGTRVHAASSPNPSRLGDCVTFVTSVAPTFADQGTPAGTVTLTEGSHTLVTLTLRHGHAQVRTSKLSAGTHTILATYSGDSKFNPNRAVPLAQVVEP